MKCTILFLILNVAVICLSTNAQKSNECLVDKIFIDKIYDLTYNDKAGEAIKSLTKKLTYLNSNSCDALVSSSNKDSILVLINKLYGGIYRHTNQINLSSKYYLEALKIGENCKCNELEKANSTYNLAGLYRLKKDFVTAEQFYSQAGENYLKLNKINDYFDTQLDILTTYSLMGLGFDDKIVSDLYQKTMGIPEIDELRKISLKVNVLEDYYFKNKKYNQLIKLYDKAIDIYEKYRATEHDWSFLIPNYIIEKKNDKANILISMKRLDEANYLVEEIEKTILKDSINLNLFHLKADLLLTRVAYHTALKQYHQAQQYHQQILQFINPQFTYQTIYQNPSLSQIFGNPYLLTTLADKAEIFKKMYSQSDDATNLKHALDCYQLSYTAADEMRKNYRFEDANTYLSAYTYNYYEKAVELCQTLAKTFPEKQKQNQYQQKALEITQRSRMKTLFWEINSRVAESTISPSSKTKLNNLKQELFEISKQLNENSNTNILKEKWFDKKQMLDQNMKQLEETNEFYAYTKFQNFSIDQESIQNTLQTNEAVLNYFMGDSLIYCFLFTQNKFKIIEIENPELVAKKVIAFRKAVDDGMATNELGYQLYQQLLEKPLKEFTPSIFNSIDNLIIIPDGILSALPFEALQKTKQYHQYILQDYTISYDLHSYFLHSRSNPNQQLAKTNTIAFSVEDFSNYGNCQPTCLLTNLAFSDEEVESIATQTKGTSVFNATKEQFLQNFQHYQIVHISTHATADTLNTGNSCIYFSRHNENESDDILYRDEILNYKCTAEMIVLSACETGFGKQNKGEGVASLARAFRTIGSRSEVMSLWNIGENSTYEIMKDFYKLLKEGKPKNEALREAKLNYIENQSVDFKKNPKSWAGLVLQGNSKPLY